MNVDGWMDGWMDGRMDGWMDGWMGVDVCMAGCLLQLISIFQLS